MIALLALLAAVAPGTAAGIGIIEPGCAASGRIPEYPGDRECLDFEAAREMTGVWINEFEGSSFHASAVSMAQAAQRPNDTWLAIVEATVLPKAFRRIYGHAYRLTFMGRRVRPRRPWSDGPPPPGGNGFGHMGMSSAMILVDRITRYEDLGPMVYR